MESWRGRGRQGPSCDGEIQLPAARKMRQCPDVALSSPCVPPVGSSPLPQSQPEVLIQRLDPGVPLPLYAHPGDAGADLTTAEDVELGPGERALVRTGIAIALPDGYAAFVHPRSGLAARHGVTLVNAPGTVDAGYRGEIKVTLLNTDHDHPVSFSRGDRIAQLVIQRVERALFHEVTVLPESSRGDGGFGSTGGHNGTAPGVIAEVQNSRSV
jgi:dUTP diphosphatase